MRGLGERQELTTCRVPSLGPRRPVALGWGSPGGQWGTTLSRSRTCLRWEAGGWLGAQLHVHIPGHTHTQNDSLHTRTHTQPEPKLCIHTCVYSQPHTHRPTSRGIITQLCKITVVKLITVLAPHPPPYSQAAPQKHHDGVTCCPIHPQQSNAMVTRGSSHTHTPPEPSNTVTPWHRVWPPSPITVLSECLLPRSRWQSQTPCAPSTHLTTPRSTTCHRVVATRCACFFYMIYLPPDLPTFLE